MLDPNEPVQPELVASALDWWIEAGVDALVDEEPVAWLERARPSVAVARETPAAPPVSAERPKPENLDALMHWLNQSDELHDAGPPAQRIAASGTAGSALMILVDMPDPGDAERGELLSGEAGALFERMLAAIGETRETTYIAALCPGRPPGAILSDRMVAQMTPMLRQHIGLAAPKRLWLAGQTVSRAIAGADAVPGSGCLRKINHEGRIMESVASFAPRFLLQHPKRKASAWEDLQLLIGGLNE